MFLVLDLHLKLFSVLNICQYFSSELDQYLFVITQ